jgi:hypothetical protein
MLKEDVQIVKIYSTHGRGGKEAHRTLAGNLEV